MTQTATAACFRSALSTVTRGKPAIRAATVSLSNGLLAVPTN
jgi:hypothetical protein